MRTTVGSLPSSVYWRRRAVVLGAILLGIIVLFVSCSQSGNKSDPKGKSASSSRPLTNPSNSLSASPDDTPSFVSPGPGQALPNPNQVQSQQAGGLSLPTQQQPPASQQPTNGGNTGTNTDVNANGSCADNMISLTVSPGATTIKRGSSVPVTIRIKNVSSGTCTRDVGSGPQELYVQSGAATYWSSDKCSGAGGNDVQQFATGAERDYNITWNGRESSSCTGNAAAGPTPPPGQYQLRARLGSLVSQPVTLTFVS